MSFEELDRALHPRSIAIIGASDNAFSWGYFYMRWCTDYGYRGRIYPVNPGKKEILGFKAYPSLRDIPDSIDYVICCLPPAKVPQVLVECVQKGVKVVNLIAAGFSETEESEGIELEQEISRRARELGVHIIGPNCMGVYHPRVGISFGFELPRESGPVGMFLQSGGIPTEFIRYASLRGIRFSKVISYGNSIDLNEADFLEYFRRDPETRVILGYLEGSKDGGRFLRELRKTASIKPVIIIKGGRSDAGTRATASHTASLAGSRQVWQTALRQSGAISVPTLEEAMDLLVSFCFVAPPSGRRVGVVGGGGGKSVLSADIWEGAGFDVIPLPSEIREEMKKKLPLIWWGWIKNPFDNSAMPESAQLAGANIEMLKLVAASPHFDLLVANISVEAPFEENVMTFNMGREVDTVLELSRRKLKPLAVMMPLGALGGEELEHWRWKFLAQQKARLVAAQVAVYHGISQAATALDRMMSYYERKM